MQIDLESFTLLEKLAPFIVTFVGYGALREKVRNNDRALTDLKNALEKETDQIRAELLQEQARYVTLVHFDTAMSPLQRGLDKMGADINTLQNDIKILLSRSYEKKT
jgi:hypothetical protein